MPPVALLAGVLVFASVALLYWAQEERLTGEGNGRDDRHTAQLAECVLASMRAGVLVVDTLGRVSMVNGEGASILGAGHDELIGRSLFGPPALAGFPALVSQARAAAPAGVRT